MHTTIDYSRLSREDKDKKAIADIREYCSPKQWDALIELAAAVSNEQAKFGNMNFAFAIIGVDGFPFHAFCRKYCLKPYIEWMTTGDDAQVVDGAGFIVE